MSSGERRGAEGPPSGAAPTGWQRLAVPVRSTRFWLIQGVILLVIALHTVVLESFDGRDIDGVPAPLTSSLMLIPVLYAALSYGAIGAFATASWSIALFAVHWLAVHRHPLTSEHLWIELVGLLVLSASGVVVGRRVDIAREAHRRTEQALEQAAVAEERFRDLFEHQPSPVVITDHDDVVIEMNEAAQDLLGGSAVGRPLAAVTGLDGHALVAQESPVAMAGPDGQVHHYVASTHSIGEGRRLVTQIVLADVSREHRRREVQRALTGRVVQAQEQERLHLSRELHDDALQQLTHLARALDELSRDPNLPSELARTAGQSVTIASTTATALRRLIQGLRPPVLDDLGLVPALRQLTEELGRHTELQVQFRTVGEIARASVDVELAAYRIAQEALTNVLKHAQAHHVVVEVSFGRQMTLEIRDDGRGFTSSARSGRGLGLLGARERAAGVGATLTVDSQPGAGTSVRVVLPHAQPPSTNRDGASPS